MRAVGLGLGRSGIVLLTLTVGCASPRVIEPPRVDGPAGRPGPVVLAPGPDAGAAAKPLLVAPPGPFSLVRRGASLFGTDVIGLPTGEWITPDAAPGSRLFELDPHLADVPAFRAGGAVAAVLSPDGATLAVLTSGYNKVFDPDTQLAVPAASSEWVFLYDVTSGEPQERQVLAVPNAFGGVAFGAAGDRLRVGGGSDDVLHDFARDERGRWSEVAPPVPLGHLDEAGRGGKNRQSPYAAGVAEAGGGLVVVANHENDSVSLVDAGARKVVAEVPLVPGGGRAGGEFPSQVLAVGGRLFVTCQRDREVVEVDLASGRVVRRIPVGGAPTKLVASRSGARLYVANANSDSVSVVDVARGRVIATIPTAAPPGSAALRYRGSNPNALALSPDESRLYVTNGGNATVAVIDLATKKVLGLIPTGYYPTAIAVARDGGHLYVTHAKSPTGPNPLGPWTAATAREHPYSSSSGNQYSLQLERAGLLSIPTPDAASLAKLTRQAMANDRFDVDPATPPPLFEALRRAGAVKHVIYVIGENRTYDQLLGDVSEADGDPRLVLWGAAITPNHHALARTFLTLDRFFDAGGVSGEGWQWSTSGRTTDVAEKAIPVEYASRGRHSYDWEGANRYVNVSWGTLAERRASNPSSPDDADLVPGTADVGAVDGPDEGGTGFLWDAALAAKLDVRNYGAFCDDSRYALPPGDPAYVAPLTDPAATKTRVSFPTRRALHDRTDPYFRCFDMRFADFWRAKEWARDFGELVKKGRLPALEIVRLPHDHLGDFDTAADGVDTPDTQMADNDYALGMIVETVARSPYWKDTVVVAIEDDAQNGSDHVDAHRSFALFAGAHVRRGGAVVSTPYATPSVLRTIELLLGLAPLGQDDAFAPPMSEVLDLAADTTPFVAQVPDVLRSTRLPLPASPTARAVPPRGDAAYWASATRGQRFDEADALDTAAFNRALVQGLLGARR